MKIHEIITEAINFARYSDDVEALILNAIADAVSKMENTGVTNNYRNSVAKHETIDPLKIFLAEDLQKNIKANIKKALSKFASTIILNKKTGISVSWKKMDVAGLQNAYNIYINSAMADMLVMASWEAIDNYVFATYIEHPYDDMWSLFKNKEALIKYLHTITDDNFRKAIRQLYKVFIHELVHVRQDLPQMQKGIEEPEYRSYLDTTKGEFASNQVKDEQRRKKLYNASPQEIEARSHELAIHIIRNHFKNRSDVASYTPADIRAIIDEVPTYAKKGFPNPTTPEEIAVYRRYISKIIQQIRDYVDNKI